MPCDELNLQLIPNHIKFFPTVLLLGSIFCIFSMEVRYEIFCNEEWKGLDLEMLDNKLWPSLTLGAVWVFFEWGTVTNPSISAHLTDSWFAKWLYIKSTLDLQFIAVHYWLHNARRHSQHPDAGMAHDFGSWHKYKGFSSTNCMVFGGGSD